MKIYFNKTNIALYVDDIHKTIPSGSVEITQEQYKALLDGQSQGKQIGSDENGNPILVAPPAITQTQLIYKERVWRDGELMRSDIELNKVQDADSKAVGSVSDWRSYRKALRALPEHPLFPAIEARPVAPDA